jgi:Protein of unknown function (DUF2637)
MPTISDTGIDAGMARRKRGAAWFFWLWLIAATAMSVTGNVAHAVLHAESKTVALAAGAALVLPPMLLAATHSIAVLIRTRAGGLTYWCALLMTLALASCAFVLSFDALRSLAVTLGLPTSIARLWPWAIDVAIAQATLCLLSLSRHTTVAHTKNVVAAHISPTTASHGEPPPKAPVRHERASVTAERVSTRNGSSVRTPVKEICEPASAPETQVAPADIERWQPIAESIVHEGVTSKHPRLVATILASREAGVPPSTIGRHNRVHHTTVGRILFAAETLAT